MVLQKFLPQSKRYNMGNVTRTKEVPLTELQYRTKATAGNSKIDITNKHLHCNLVAIVQIGCCVYFLLSRIDFRTKGASKSDCYELLLLLILLTRQCFLYVSVLC